MKTLVVEDEKLIAEALREILEALGYEVCAITSSASEADEVLRTVKPDLMLVDIQLGGERDGIDLAHEVRRRFEFPIVFITSFADEVTVRRAKAIRPEGYLVKPITKNSVFAALEMATVDHSPVGEEEESRDRPSPRGLTPNRLRRVKQFVHQCYAEDVSLDVLAETVSMSKFHFCRSFRESTGVTPYQYVLQVRVDRAKRLLTTTDHPVGSVAEEVGFRSASQFSRAFRRLAGMTALEYRRSH